MLGIVRFASILLTGLALIAPGAHLLELPNKIMLAKEPYFVVQQIYSGWWIVGLLLPLALLANLVHAVLAAPTDRRYGCRSAPPAVSR